MPSFEEKNAEICDIKILKNVPLHLASFIKKIAQFDELKG